MRAPVGPGRGGGPAQAVGTRRKPEGPAFVAGRVARARPGSATAGGPHSRRSYRARSRSVPTAVGHADVSSRGVTHPDVARPRYANELWQQCANATSCHLVYPLEGGTKLAARLQTAHETPRPNRVRRSASCRPDNTGMPRLIGLSTFPGAVGAIRPEEPTTGRRGGGGDGDGARPATWRGVALRQRDSGHAMRGRSGGHPPTSVRAT